MFLSITSSKTFFVIIIYIETYSNSSLIPGGDSLGGLTSLRRLNLGSNRLSALPSSLFNRSNQLTELGLQNNSLAMLPVGVFGGLESLLVLNLSQNAITSHLLTRDTFRGMPSLQVQW